MEVSALKHQPLALRGSAPLLRLAGDEKLVALIRRGQHSAFEALVGRYQVRLLAFCRHMLRSPEDAEDILQEVFAAAFNALLADEREINVRPWLYRIARNRCLNHLRRQTAVGVDSMDVLFADHGQSTVEKASKREDFRLLLEDIGRLPETQRTALVLREMDALSYEQIAEAMDTTVPSVKSLLVRARVSLAEAAEARKLSCGEVRLELAAIAEGIATLGPPIRRHVKDCDRCRSFRAQLRQNNRALALVLPVGPLLLLKKLVITKAGFSFGGGAGGAAGAGASAGVAGGTAAGALTTGALATKAVAGLAAAALVTAGAVEVRHAHLHPHRMPGIAAVRHPAAAREERLAEPAPIVVRSDAQPLSSERPSDHARRAAPKPKPKPKAKAKALALAPAPALQKRLVPASAPAPTPTPPATQQVSATTVLPPQPPTTVSTAAPSPPPSALPPPPTTAATPPAPVVPPATPPVSGPSGPTGATAPTP
ncbi:MAG: hypothetical protein NVSMB51_16190 [Solirubrobacteraceae bacterium]